MSNSILPGFFTTGPDDSLRVLDVYDIKESANSTNDTINSAVEGLKSLSTNSGVSDVAEIIDTVIKLGASKGGKGCIKPINSQRISNEVSGGNINTTDLCGNTATSLVEAIANFDANEIDTVYDIAGNAIAVVRGVEATEVQRIIDLAKDFTEDAALTAVKDTAASRGIRNTLIGEAVRMGLSTLLDSLFSDKDEVDTEASLKLVGTAIKNGDTKTLVKLVRLLGRDRVLQRYPNIISDVLSTYRFPLKTTTSDYSRLLTELKSDLNEIDPEWMWYVRDGERIISLKHMRAPSKDAVALFMLDEDLRGPVLIADTYKSFAIDKIAQRFYPLAAV